MASFQVAALGAGCLYLGLERGPLRPVVKTLSGCGAAGIAGIGQLADVAGRPQPARWDMEIRIVLDRVEPPTGRLRVIRAPGQAYPGRAEQDIGSTGWLGLLRALYEVTTEPTAGPGHDRVAAGCRACLPVPQ